MFIFRDVAFILTLSHVVSVLTLYINNCLPHLETRSSDLVERLESHTSSSFLACTTMNTLCHS